MKAALALSLFAVVIGSACTAPAAADSRDPTGLLHLVFRGPTPGAAQVTTQGDLAMLSNNAIAASWSWAGKRLVPATVVDKLSKKPLPAPREAFVLKLRGGTALKASELTVLEAKTGSLAADPKAIKLADRMPGQEITARLATADGSIAVTWIASLRDEANYIRQEIVITPVGKPADVARLTMVDHDLPAARVVGKVPGSPIVAGAFFTGYEHPMATAWVDAGRATMGLDLALPLRPGKTLAASSVMGVVPKGQLRRGVLYYIERQRAHAYRPFLHYNSWYDIGYFTPYNEKDCLAVIEAFAKELGGRGVTMDSFLFDDGWDDTAQGGRWLFHRGFPNGFTPLRDAAAKVGAAPGVWLSPWGGGGKPRIERRKSAQAAGFETVPTNLENTGKPEYDRVLALSGPKYYESFHRACLDMVTRYGINQFKLDGTGSVNTVIPGSRFGSDFEAAISLIRDLRQARPGLFINLTTGTWPSPFWLPICDSIWRGGEDHDFAGVGSFRQRWITYRDGDTYARIVQGGPLYPLNSLMLHGIIYAKHAKNLDRDPGNDFAAEVRSYFGTGTQLQEMYISHELLTKENWDELAAAAKWARVNAKTLVDTHWVGGDPCKLEVYGHAAFSFAKGILVLRNPADKEAKFTVELRKLFEMPGGMPKNFHVRAPFAQRKVELADMLDADTPAPLTLRPFEVLVFEMRPE